MSDDLLKPKGGAFTYGDNGELVWAPEPSVSPEEVERLIERGECDPEPTPEIKRLIAEADAEPLAD